MEDDIKVKLLAEQKALGIRKLLRIGDSYALTLPKFWVRWHCFETDGEYYVQLTVEGSMLRFSPIDEDTLKKVMVREK